MIEKYILVWYFGLLIPVGYFLGIWGMLWWAGCTVCFIFMRGSK